MFPKIIQYDKDKVLGGTVYIRYLSDHSAYGRSQREETLRCNFICHWLSPYPARFLYLNLTHWGRVTHVCVVELDHHWFRWWFVVCSVPGHHLNQCWVIINWTLRNISVKFWSEFQHFNRRKCFWKCLRSGVHFVSHNVLVKYFQARPSADITSGYKTYVLSTIIWHR